MVKFTIIDDKNDVLCIYVTGLVHKYLVYQVYLPYLWFFNKNDKVSAFALSIASKDMEQSSLTTQCLANDAPNADAILLGSGL